MQRNNGLDLLKTICAFMIICVHAPFPGLLGDIFTPLARIAVPVFFMITGYYYSLTKERKKEKKQIIKVLKLFLSANVLYVFWSLVKVVMNGDSITAFIGDVFSIKTILGFLVFNESPFGGHLWYLGAILYVLVVVSIFEKKWDRKKLYPLIPVLLLLDLVLGKYSLVLLGTEIPYIFIRNFICVGLPYFLIGDMLNTRNSKIKPVNGLLLTVAFAITTLIERGLLVYFNVNANRDHYISTTFLAIVVFLLAVQFNSKSDNKCFKALCYTGERLSTSIYILHPIFIMIVDKMVKIVSKFVPVYSAYKYIAPFVVMLVTAIVAWLYLIVVKKAKVKLSNK
jgi:surface polysaccharide O-acyltransferase-like enzyme